MPMLRAMCRATFGLLVMAIIVLSVLPHVGTPPQVSDKTLHLIAYFAVTAAGLLGWLSLRAGALVLAGTVALGGILEIVQSMVPGRSCELADFIANLAGCILAALAIAGLRRTQIVRHLLSPERP